MDVENATIEGRGGKSDHWKQRQHRHQELRSKLDWVFGWINKDEEEGDDEEDEEEAVDPDEDHENREDIDGEDGEDEELEKEDEEERDENEYQEPVVMPDEVDVEKEDTRLPYVLYVEYSVNPRMRLAADNRC